MHNYDGIEASANFTADEAPYVDAFGAATQALIATLPSAVTRAAARNKAAPGGEGGGVSGVYSTACYNHHISEKTSYFTTTSEGGVTEADAVLAFLDANGVAVGAAGARAAAARATADPTRAAGAPLRWIDSCVGVDCGAGC